MREALEIMTEAYGELRACDELAATSAAVYQENYPDTAGSRGRGRIAGGSSGEPFEADCSRLLYASDSRW